MRGKSRVVVLFAGRSGPAEDFATIRAELAASVEKAGGRPSRTNVARTSRMGPAGDAAILRCTRGPITWRSPDPLSLLSSKCAPPAEDCRRARFEIDKLADGVV